MSVDRAEVAIIGGGIAGLSTALHLARSGQRGIVLLDREEQPGTYASGHNAAIARSLTGRPEHSALTVEGRWRLAEAGLLDMTGGLLLAVEKGALEPFEAEARSFGVEVQRGAGSSCPGLRASEHLAIPGDGVIDIAGLLRHCAEGARAGGAELRFGCALRGLERNAEGFRLDTERGLLEAKALVIASGAWAGEVGRWAGSALTFTPLRRSLVWSGAAHPANRPWAWWVDRPFYFRPESGGLLMCPCEEAPVPLPARGRQPDADASVLEGLYGSLRELAPDLAERPITRYWTGLRTFAPDRRFVLGWDPGVANLFWVAGLGGHGMTSGLAVGALAADLFRGRATTELAAARFGGLTVAAGSLRVALVQQATVWEDPAANLARARGFVAEAARSGARVVVFPELATTGFTMAPEAFAEPLPGPTTEAIAALAREFGLYVIGTVVEAHAPHPRNAAFVTAPDGSLLAIYRKLHPFTYGEEHRHYVGGDDCPVFALDGIPCGLQICYDLRFPEPFRALAAKGVEIVFLPANWPVRRIDAWSTLLAARAIENQMAVCGVNRVGRDPQAEYPGRSAILDPFGVALATGGDTEGLVVGDLDLAKLRAWRERFPALQDRRPEVYGRL